jgi:hypothetical protein
MRYAVGLYFGIGLLVATTMASSRAYDQSAVLFAVRTLAWPLAIVPARGQTSGCMPTNCPPPKCDAGVCR